MLNKWNFEVAKFASKEESRYTLQAIQVHPDKTVATDGHRLLIVGETDTPLKDFPKIDGLEPQEKFKPFLLGAKDALDVAKAVPKDKKIPALNHVAVGKVTERSTGVEAVPLGVTDLATSRVFAPSSFKGTFPDFDKVIPTTPPALEIHLDTSYLRQIADFMEKAGSDEPIIRLRFWDAESAVRIDGMGECEGQYVTAILMPKRAPDEPIVGYGEKKVEEAPEKQAGTQ